MAKETVKTRDILAGVARAVVALLYCFAALVVLENISSNNHWGEVQFRAPILALVPWAYTLKWKNRLVAILSYVSLLSIMTAFLLITLPVGNFEFHSSLMNVLALTGFTTLLGALSVHAWLAFWGWRADRKRLREISHGPLERLSGGY